MARPPAVPLSRKESRGYYTGLPDCPTLVERSTTVYDNDVYEKLLDPVEKHAVVPLWNDSAGSLRRKILEAVKGVDWNAIDIFRCGYTSLGYCHLVRPVILFVSVAKAPKVYTCESEIPKPLWLWPVDMSSSDKRKRTSTSVTTPITPEVLFNLGTRGRIKTRWKIYAKPSVG
ncbi:hypothetical protein LZL87_010948 [Fusarium oxysporum]|nr:hypothetical protein LZL87_010948 [Fusarium oxysporum]